MRSTLTISAFFVLLIFICCKGKEENEVPNSETVQPDTVVLSPRESPKIYRPKRDVVLSSGVILPQSNGEMEIQLVGFLNESYKSSKEIVYFVFDDVSFEENSAQLTSGSDVQIQNVATILKQFPEVKFVLRTYDSGVGEAQELTRRQSLKVYEKLRLYGISNSQLPVPVFTTTSMETDRYAGIVLGVLPPRK